MDLNSKMMNITISPTNLTGVIISFSCRACLFFPIHSATFHASAVVKLFSSYASAVLGTALIRAKSWITISPFIKFFAAPLANKRFGFRQVSIIFGTFPRTVNTFLAFYYSKFFAAHFANAFLLSASIMTCLGTILRIFSFSPLLLPSKFFPALSTNSYALYVLVKAFTRTILRNISWTSIAVIKFFTAVNTNKIIFRGFISHRTVSSFVKSRLFFWARRLESGACQRFMTPFKPIFIISQLIVNVPTGAYGATRRRTYGTLTGL